MRYQPLGGDPEPVGRVPLVIARTRVDRAIDWRDGVRLKVRGLCVVDRRGIGTDVRRRVGTVGAGGVVRGGAVVGRCGVVTRGVGVTAVVVGAGVIAPEHLG